VTGPHRPTILIAHSSSSHSPGSVLQVGMRLMPLIAAHLAAHLNGYAIFTPGLGHIAASGTIAEKAGHYL